MAKRFSLRFTLFLVVSDIALLLAAIFLAAEARILLPYGKTIPASAVFWPFPIYVLALVVWGLAFTFSNVYAPGRAVHLVGELQTVALVTGISFFAFTGALYLSFRDASRLQVIYLGAIYLILIIAHRIALRQIFAQNGGRRSESRRVLIVGTGKIAQEVGSTVQKHAWTGLHLVGYVYEGQNGDVKELSGVPVIGSLNETLLLTQKYLVSEIVIALPSQAQQNVTDLIYELHSLPINTRIVPDYFELAFLRLRVEEFGGMPLITLKEPSINPFQRLIKRVFDILIAALLLVLTMPIMAIVALAIKLDNSGPIFFKQQRMGEGGRLFTMYKFRSMGAESSLQKNNLGESDGNGQFLHKNVNDPRVTRVGHILRRFSLDELPQLINVLQGDMSLVGPRPELPWLVERYQPWQRKRFEVPQGMTGWWQVSGRSDKPLHLNTEEDLFYIRNYSPWLDLEILWRTIGVVIRGRGAY